MSDFLKPTVIKLEPNWFKQGYYVYLVNIKYINKNFNYIGMTGDRKAIIARSPFFRMSGHFNQRDGSSENQITKGLKKIIKPNLDFHEELGKMMITYYVYKIRNFDKKNHHEKRIATEQIESWLILKFKDDNRIVFNGKISNKPVEKTEKEAMPIYIDMLKRITYE